MIVLWQYFSRVTLCLALFTVEVSAWNCLQGHSCWHYLGRHSGTDNGGILALLMGDSQIVIMGTWPAFVFGAYMQKNMFLPTEKPHFLVTMSYI